MKTVSRMASEEKQKFAMKPVSNVKHGGKLKMQRNKSLKILAKQAQELRLGYELINKPQEHH